MGNGIFMRSAHKESPKYLEKNEGEESRVSIYSQDLRALRVNKSLERAKK